jgi:hypothetical protein
MLQLALLLKQNKRAKMAALWASRKQQTLETFAKLDIPEDWFERILRDALSKADILRRGFLVCGFSLGTFMYHALNYRSDT